MAWPAVALEAHPWTIDESSTMPRAARRRHQGPYDSAVVPEIRHVDELGVGAAVLALAEEASTEVARFDAEVGGDIAPFSALLLRSESAASSQIEKLTASSKAIALAELGDPSRSNAAAIVANTRAMQAAIDLADRLDEDAIVQMHRVLLEGVRPEWTGRWRDQQVWIQGSDWGPHGASFVPPHHSRVPAAMGDLVAFVRRDDLPAFAQAAIAHAQFETIHPFPDGNGRTGRSLIHAMLRAKQVTRQVTVPVSAGLLTDTDRYFDALTAYRGGEPAAIVDLLASASFRAITNGRELVADLNAIRSDWGDRLHARRDAAVWRILPVLTRQPVIDSPSLQARFGLSAPTVNSAIETLVEARILRKVSGNHRNRKWAATEVLAALDAFAERSGPRARHG